MSGKMGRVGKESRRQRRPWLRWLSPPVAAHPNPRERDFEKAHPLGRWNLYIGGAGNRVPGFVNIDLFGLAGVDVVCSTERLPFRENQFSRVECDAVLEHVEDPRRAIDEIHRCLKPGGIAHFVVPFCHPFHEYPKDYRRYTPDGLGLLLGSRFEVIDSGWRTGPTATWLVFTLEYAKSWSRARWTRRCIHFLLGWALFPLRYLDALLFRFGDLERMGNHHYVYVSKR